MNTSKLLFAAFLFTALSANAHTYQCLENSNSKPRSQKISVTVQELADITKYVSFGKHFDFVYKVRVTINEPSQPTRSFEAVATSMDVAYNVSAVKKQGIHIGIYLDEADDANIEFTSASGKKRNVNLICR